MPMPKEQPENSQHTGQELGFEASLNSLERIVAQLESGDLPLERALGIFEEGVGLARRCQEKLTEAERKVELLLRERGEIKAVPFELQRESETTMDNTSQPPGQEGRSITPLPASKKEFARKVADDDVIPF
jgi:exodeoxyribonuclease VII small subunit